LGFNAVFEKENPSQVRLFDADTFKAHLETPHFEKYAETTKDMVKSRKRIDNVPITPQREGEVNGLRGERHESCSPY
jgi:4-carboxymuconolactone decarboxylase